MRLREYATADEFLNSAYCDDPQQDKGDVRKLIRRASSVIESLTLTARYETDEDGMPTNLDVSETLRDAVCAQVAYLQETGDASGALAAGSGASIGSLNLSGKAMSGREARESRYAPEAVELLTNAGLMPLTVGR